MGNIPALTYTIHHSTDRLRRQHDYYEQEILMSRLLMMGHPDYLPTTSFGVVSANDPTGHTAGSSDPLAVSVNSSNQLAIDVNPGVAVMRSGVWIELHDIVRQIALAESAVGVPNVVYLRYLLDDAPPESNYFQQSVVPYTLRVGDPLDSGVTVNTESVLIGVVTVTTYQQLAASVTDDIVPLAVATVQATTTGTVTTNELTVDHTQNSYTFNRPWFSPVDWAHRSQVGTGTVTDTNPHGTSQNDLTVGTWTAFQTHLDHGVILAKDQSIAKVPGYRCTSAITTVSTDDASGTVTGYANASYIELPYFPVCVGRVWNASTNEELGAIHVPQTNRVVFPYETPTVGATLNVYYTRAQACEPPLPSATTFTTTGPSTEELIIAGGIGLTSLTTTEETFSDAYQFPMRYEMFVDGESTLRKTPQVVYCFKLLDTIGTSDTTDDITPYGPGRLMMGLLGANDVSTLSVKIRVYGTDINGTSIDELFEFTQGSWNPVGTIPVIPDPTSISVHFSDNVFATITSLTVEERTDDGPNSGIMIWMAQTPFSNYDDQADVAHVATVDWDGLRMANVYDKRIVATTVRDELTAEVDAGQFHNLYTLLAGGNSTVYVEDFRRPRYDSLQTPDELGALGFAAYYPTYQFSKQQVGLHGYYKSIAFPVSPSSSTTWRVAFFGIKSTVDAWFTATPTLFAFHGGGWNLYNMSAVPGIPGTYEATTTAVPSRVQLRLFPAQVVGYAIYG